MPKTKEIEPLNVSFNQGVRGSRFRTKMSKTVSGGPMVDVVAGLESHIAAFEKENPNFVKELDLLGFEIDEYEKALASSEPQVTLTTKYYTFS